MLATYEFTLTGKSPLLMHRDDIVGADELKEWREDPRNGTVSVRGDDRSPAWTWMTYLYTSQSEIIVPQELIMGSLRDAGKQMILKGKKTFKEATQYGILPTAEWFPLLVGGKPISTKPISPLRSSSDFNEHKSLVGSLGFALFISRPRIGQAKHVRVRPRFEEWAVKGMVHVSEPAITEPVLRELFAIAGDRAGIGDWRPSSKAPGPFGRFDADVKRVA